MAFDQHKNFAVSAVAVAPSPPNAGTSLTVMTNEGVRFPPPPFNATVCSASTQPTPATAEVVRVTAIAGDQFTLARGQEGSTTRSIVIGDLISATITTKSFTDLETNPAFVGSVSASSFLQIGTNPAQSGGLRIPNAVGMFGRNAANSADVYMASIDPNNVLVLGGPLSSPSQPRCSVAGPDQSLPTGVWTILSLPNETFDVGNMHNPALPSRVAAPADGVYLAAGTVSFSANATGIRYYQLYKNGAGYRMLVVNPVADVTAVQIVELVSLVAGDYLELAVLQNTAGALTSNGTLSVAKLW
jgi:hypothetical protein